MILSKTPRDRDELLHRVVGIDNNSRTEEQSLDIIPTVEIKRQLHDFLRRETGSGRVAGDAGHQ